MIRLHDGRLLAALLALLALSAASAQAQAWIPQAGTGTVEPMVRYAFSDTAFPADTFSTETRASSSEQKVQFRITGDYGLGDGFSLNYDFRYAYRHSSDKTAGGSSHRSSSGFQEQRIGLDYGLTQDPAFADSIGLGVIVPGGGARSVHLDSGRWAVEPIYNLGFKPGFWKLSGYFDVGSRIFLDGGATQFRTHLGIGAPVLDGVWLSGKLFFARTVRMGAYDARDSGELYNVLRLGVEARFRLTDSVHPVLGYESEVAGMGRHAEQRLTVGCKLSF